MTLETPESRTARLTVAVTPSEEHAAKTVAMVDRVEGGLSGLLRTMSVEQIIARHAVIVAAVPPRAVAA